MSVQHSEHPLVQKQIITFASIIVIGAMAILLGLTLIIYAHYHERAYVFLALGAGCFIGGIAGIVLVGQKAKIALGYGMIALGMVSFVIGINYLIGSYGPGPNQAHAVLVIIVSIIVFLIGIIGALIAQPRAGIAALLSVITLGVIGSIGITALIVGTVFLSVLDYPKYAYLLLGTGTLCLSGGIICAIFAQRKVKS